MKISTLETIHNLLREKYEVECRAYKKAYDAQKARETILEEAGRPTNMDGVWSTLEDVRIAAIERKTAVHDALLDFEGYEF